MHKTVLRQFKKIFGEASIDSLPDDWKDFLKLVSDTYQGYDEDRALIERSLEISSNELGEKTERLQRELKEIQEGKAYIQKLEEARRATLNILKDLKAAQEESEAARKDFEDLAEKERERRIEFEKLNKFMVGRELKMAELKEENARLKAKLGLTG